MIREEIGATAEKGCAEGHSRRPSRMCTTLADQINSELLAFIKD